MPTPQALHSSSINPANLVELQVLTQVITQLQSSNDIAGTIPYLAKIVQIVNNQNLSKPTTQLPKYYQQLNQLRLVQADAYSQLAEAYFHTHQFIKCESNLLASVRIWEKLVQHGNVSEDLKPRLKQAYVMLKACYEDMGKGQLAQHMEIKLSRISSDDA
ncbi:hypothetical protein MFLAVUS_006491 [Mucor flavus]|uniref:Uncharacterized protein n=1 Tax=Mucor flavus TaxID=439312 RepID=A0ABP9Z1P5_9FUNG